MLPEPRAGLYRSLINLTVKIILGWRGGGGEMPKHTVRPCT